MEPMFDDPHDPDMEALLSGESADEFGQDRRNGDDDDERSSFHHHPHSTTQPHDREPQSAQQQDPPGWYPSADPSHVSQSAPNNHSSSLGGDDDWQNQDKATTTTSHASEQPFSFENPQNQPPQQQQVQENQPYTNNDQEPQRNGMNMQNGFSMHQHQHQPQYQQQPQYHQPTHTYESEQQQNFKQSFSTSSSHSSNYSFGEQSQGLDTSLNSVPPPPSSGSLVHSQQQQQEMQQQYDQQQQHLQQMQQNAQPLYQQHMPSPQHLTSTTSSYSDYSSQNKPVLQPTQSSGMEPSAIPTQSKQEVLGENGNSQTVASAPPPPPAKPAASNNEVIDLLDSDSDDEKDNEPAAAKRQKTQSNPAPTYSSGLVHTSTGWVRKHAHPASRIHPGTSIGHHPAAHSLQRFPSNPTMMHSHSVAGGMPTPDLATELQFPSDFVPTWTNFFPTRGPIVRKEHRPKHSDTYKRYQLSLLNVNEFTIEGLPIHIDGPPTSVAGLRIPIRKISKGHGKAVFDQSGKNEDGEDEEAEDGSNNVNGTNNTPRVRGTGRWRIPLGAYHAFVSYLQSDPKTDIYGIPTTQLQIASLERARQEKGYPSVETIMNDHGVPKGLAHTLAPFQRGGVDFVVAKEGRALIADEMGLGKTIQAIAAMSVYMDEWPLLILTPSSARYHWENEFLQWLGLDSDINKEKYPGTDPYKLIQKSQIHVLTSSKDDVIPNHKTRVVICSYGLAPTLAESGSIFPGLFKCAIVDESHMLKNNKTKRTAALTPVLQSTNRCVLLSGTPALAKPGELWPQLSIIGTEKHGWDGDEAEFTHKYVRRGNPRTRAELHALLTGTVMIRRYKSNILKNMKPKIRQKAQLHVINHENHNTFKNLLNKLRKGKGALAKLARTKEVETIQADVRRQVHEGIANSQQHAQDSSTPNSPEMQLKEDTEQENQWDGEETEQTKRANILTKLYSLTGEVKVPVVAEMLNRWLDDPTKGKLCIFAHHLSVLNSLRDICKLSNDSSSTRQFIRIDGATNPKVRQEQINTFQNNPACRVALLGITAAGVAVTLTASSTVWFAELFWTPAIMIQAEDRCHRIGQQSQVECVYFVGRGTLDDVLWKLVEKKFQALGEFVEGKEKDKMVINKTFSGAKDFLSIFESRESLESEIAEDTSVDEDLGPEFVPLDAGLVHDIEELGEDERRMLKNLEGEDDDADSDSKPKAAPRNSSSPANQIGSSQEAAITLSDDEDEEENPVSTQNEGSANAISKPDLFNKSLVGCTYFQVTFHGPQLGVDFQCLRGRVVVSRIIHRNFQSNVYETAKPRVGDVLIWINNRPFHVIKEVNQAAVDQYFRDIMTRPPARVVFARHPELTEHAEEALRQQQATRSEQADAATPATPAIQQSSLAVTPPETIELD